MINNLNASGIPENNPAAAPSAAFIEDRQATSSSHSGHAAQSPVALAAQRAANAMSAYAPQIARPSMTRAGESSSSLGGMAQQYSTHLLESTQPPAYLGNRRYPIIQIRTGNLAQEAESSRQITDMLIMVMKQNREDRRNRDIELDPNYLSSEFTFFTHQFNLAMQLYPANPALNVIVDQLSASEIRLMPLLTRPSRLTAQQRQQAPKPRAIPQTSPPASAQGRPPITPPTRASTRPLTTPPSGPSANPETKRVKADDSTTI